LKQVVQVVTVVTRLFLLANFCHHLVTTVTTLMAAFGVKRAWRLLER
jgi:hypothetical protein